MTAVKVVREQGGSAQIEWTDRGALHKGFIPVEVLHLDPTTGEYTVGEDFLSLAIPYGIQWETILPQELRSVTATAIAQELRMRGIWTLNDLRKKPQVVFAALQTLYALDFQILLRAAEDFEKLNSGRK